MTAPAHSQPSSKGDMIIARIYSGMGNQLFQYAMGRSLSLHHGVPLKLDATYFDRRNDRAYGLGHFAISCEKATPAEIASTRGYGDGFLARNWYSLRKRLNGPSPMYRVEGRRFHADFREWPTPLYLKGIWPNERYFIECERQLRSDLRIVTPPMAETVRIMERIRAASDSTSVHVRRGDYVANAANVARFGSLSIDWYRRAAERVRSRAGAPEFFVFSDDIAWARAHLDLGERVVYVDHTSEATCIDDFAMMSMCRHHITANSTFSWWAAWLDGRTPAGQVICPPPLPGLHSPPSPVHWIQLPWSEDR